MIRRILLASAAVATLALGVAAAPATAGNVAWSVSVGVPGVAVTAGAPGFVGPGYWGPGFAPVWQPAFVAPPPMFVPVAAPVVYRPFVRYGRPVVVVPRPVYGRAWRGPVPYRY